jgi:hypothetical protein
MSHTIAKRFYAVVIVTALMVGVGGSFWSRAQLREYQAREGLSSTWSLFSRPQGDHYRFWGTTVPFASSAIALLLLGIIVTIVGRRERVRLRDLIVMWSFLLAVTAAVFGYVMLYLSILASDFFI